MGGSETGGGGGRARPGPSVRPVLTQKCLRDGRPLTARTSGHSPVPDRPQDRRDGRLRGLPEPCSVVTAICANIGYAFGCNACTPAQPSELVHRPPLPSSILPYVAYDRSPNLNTVVNARFFRVTRATGEENLRESSAVLYLFWPGFDFSYREIEVDKQPARCYYLRLRPKLCW